MSYSFIQFCILYVRISKGQFFSAATEFNILSTPFIYIKMSNKVENGTINPGQLYNNILCFILQQALPSYSPKINRQCLNIFIADSITRVVSMSVQLYVTLSSFSSVSPDPSTKLCMDVGWLCRQYSFSQLSHQRSNKSSIQCI